MVSATTGPIAITPYCQVSSSARTEPASEPTNWLIDALHGEEHAGAVLAGLFGIHRGDVRREGVGDGEEGADREAADRRRR